MLKSILKRSSSTKQEDRNLERALYHANLIQQRKDTELLILQNTETLLDLPSPDTKDCSNPSAADVFTVINLLQPFQPSDYDSLIEERNIDQKCGFVLCPHQNRQEKSMGRYKIKLDPSAGKDGINIVKRQSLEKWCSDECAKRALFLKVQLNEEPAWARAGGWGKIVLLEGGMHDLEPGQREQQLVAGFEQLDISTGEDRIMDSLRKLAIERGDQDTTNMVSLAVVKDLKENTNNSKSLPPKDEKSNGSKIEDYVPKAEYKLKQGTSAKGSIDEERDLDETISDI
ncbi:MAG: hypothetical protein LQ351_005440 [Letrouitia transgressa]|nr:MAG: hypothetical protein LQ351_005440 [Letrouitia transgressa]